MKREVKRERGFFCFVSEARSSVYIIIHHIIYIVLLFISSKKEEYLKYLGLHRPVMFSAEEIVQHTVLVKAHYLWLLPAIGRA